MRCLAPCDKGSVPVVIVLVVLREPHPLDGLVLALFLARAVPFFLWKRGDDDQDDDHRWWRSVEILLVTDVGVGLVRVVVVRNRQRGSHYFPEQLFVSLLVNVNEHQRGAHDEADHQHSEIHGVHCTFPLFRHRHLNGKLIVKTIINRQWYFILLDLSTLSLQIYLI